VQCKRIFPEKQEIVPRRITSCFGRKNVNLLIMSDTSKNQYVWIKDFSRLMSSSVSKHQPKLFWCYNCLNHFSSADVLKAHVESGCYNSPCARIVLPKEKDANIACDEFIVKEAAKNSVQYYLC
jgi:hypothetical protein